eukprot:Pgem_evm1s331
MKKQLENQQNEIKNMMKMNEKPDSALLSLQLPTPSSSSSSSSSSPKPLPINPPIQSDEETKFLRDQVKRSQMELSKTQDKLWRYLQTIERDTTVVVDDYFKYNVNAVVDEHNR